MLVRWPIVRVLAFASILTGGCGLMYQAQTAADVEEAAQKHWYDAGEVAPGESGQSTAGQLPRSVRQSAAPVHPVYSHPWS